MTASARLLRDDGGSIERRILVAIRAALYDELFAAADAQLRRLGALHFITQRDNPTSSELAAQIGGFDAVITGWGTPPFTADVLAAADRLRLIAHSAGSIKQLLPAPVFAQGRRVTHAAAALAPPVAETTLLLILLSLRRVHQIDRAFKQDSWAAARAVGLGSELGGQRVGIIGAGYTGREVIRRLRALDAELWVYDPYLSEADAAALQVQKAGLKQLLCHCPIVSLQAPATAATHRMIGAEQFSWLPDGAIFINTARAHLIDEAALLAELRAGRIFAALDVFEQEPLPADSPLRQLDNLIITPHIASLTRQARRRQGLLIAGEIDRFFTGGNLRYEVSRAMLDTMA